MTTFSGGPADGITLMLKRSPTLLRAVRRGKAPAYRWDALDLVADEPAADEEIFVYKLTHALPRPVHIRAGRGSGFFVVARYEYVRPQPLDAEVRANEAWRRWCLLLTKGGAA